MRKAWTRTRVIAVVVMTALAMVMACPTNAWAAAIDLADGTYQVDVSLEGGSGRASVSSPAEVVVSDGKARATIEWSSPHYDYMLVEGERYLPTNDGGNSTFEIPVTEFDEPLAVVADTTAMSQSHEIAYTLTFDAQSAVEDKSSATPWIAIASACTAAVVCSVFGMRARRK